jgi:short-subunit dehydrogenase involved in D-alanine esterification of teichoic acids
MLLNEFLKAHRNVQELRATLARQEALIAKQQKQIETIMATVRQVGDKNKLNELAERVASK